ncbi:ABC transporter ATP-binding protein [Pseudonocardia sp. H11422]|uniref:ABC transporter ATP-binding protein n=1 Tax=Pseudonocardia sp. H11422 TaxID=2835866 RepID=UPI001BDC1DEE|nr:ATP-binding cassette domain-containing protein [Pseudonocardia sp. H11422]
MRSRLGCRDLRVTVRARELLHVRALDVAPGRTLAVLGPNGAGKSTLVRALALLSRYHVTGQVLLDGEPAIPAVMRRAVAAVLQRPILRRGTVAANVASGLRLRGVGRAEAIRRSRPWLDALGVAHLAHRDARTVSGGEAQRISIARALAVGPRVLLLDEPFAGLDATTRADLLADLRAALDELDTAVVLVTHDRNEALALAHDTALMIDGHIRQHGDTPAVLDAPADRDCARLLGYTNLLTPRMTGQPGTLAARPEHCHALPDPALAAPGGIVVSGTLRRIVPLGGATRIDITTPDGDLACLTTGEPGLGRSGAVAFTVAAADVRRLDERAAAVPGRSGAMVNGRR